eukprot:scaffold10938_cov123-Isochrysis_galbana.AAC.2
MACQTRCRASNQQGSHPCKNSHPQPHVWALDQVGPRPSSGVGECLVGRRGFGMAVERCVVLGVGRIGSVGLPGFCVVGRWIGHHCFIYMWFLVGCAPTR